MVNTDDKRFVTAITIAKEAFGLEESFVQHMLDWGAMVSSVNTTGLAFLLPGLANHIAGFMAIAEGRAVAMPDNTGLGFVLVELSEDVHTMLAERIESFIEGLAELA